MGIVSSLDSNRYRFGDIRHCRIDRAILKIIARHARARLNPIINLKNKNDYAKSNSPVSPLLLNNYKIMDEVLEPFTSDMMEKINRTVRGLLVNADTANGKDWSGINVGNGIVDMTKCFEKSYEFVEPKIGSVFAGVIGGNVRSISAVFTKGYERKIAFPLFNLVEGVCPFLTKTNCPGVYTATTLAFPLEHIIYVRIDPDIWAKAMKIHDIYFASLNAIFKTIDPCKPFNS